MRAFCPHRAPFSSTLPEGFCRFGNTPFFHASFGLIEGR
jgi:hypothetical protein